MSKKTTTLPKYDGAKEFLTAMEKVAGPHGRDLATPIITLVNERDESIRTHVHGALEAHAKGIDDLVKVAVMDLRSSNDDFRDEIFKKLRTGFKAIFDDLDDRQAITVNLTKRDQDVVRDAEVPVRDAVIEAAGAVDRISSKSGPNTSSADIADLESKIEAIKLAQASYDERFAAIEKRLGAIEGELSDVRENAGRGADAYDGLYIDHAPSDAYPNGRKSVNTWRNETDGHIDANANYIRTLNDSVYGADGALASIDKLKNTVNGKEADGTNPAVPGHEHRISSLERKFDEAASNSGFNTKVVIAAFVFVTLAVGVLIGVTSGFSYGLLFAPLVGAVAAILAATISTGRSRVAGEKEGNHDKH